MMSRRKTGATLIAVAAFLYAARFIAAAIFSGGISSWDADLFNAMLQYVGPDLWYAAAIALAAGLVYLIWSEFESGSK
jgi:hypothetical protein